MTFEIGVAEKESSANLPFVEIGRRGNVRADGDLNKRRIYDLSELFCAPQVRYRQERGVLAVEIPVSAAEMVLTLELNLAKDKTGDVGKFHDTYIIHISKFMITRY